MPIPYLGKKSWPEISREERLFCAELFLTVRSRGPEFATWLSARPGMKNVGLDSSQPWGGSLRSPPSSRHF